MTMVSNGSSSSQPAEPLASTGAKPFLLPLHSLDLTRRVVDREGIARMNPHRGQMALIDAILWHSANFKEGVAIKQVGPDEFWVAGHFPAKPMLPGVLMVEAAAQLGVFLYNARFPAPKLVAFTHIDRCSFRHAVVPGDDLLLLCKEVKFSPRRFISDIQGLVNGKIAFEAQINGVSLAE